MFTVTHAIPLLRVADVARTVAWYRDVLGFDANTFPAQPPYDFAILFRDGTEIMASCDPEHPRPATAIGWDVYLRLAGGRIREVFADLSARGVVTRRLERMFYGLAEFNVRDPDGYVLCLAEELADLSDLPAAVE